MVQVFHNSLKPSLFFLVIYKPPSEPNALPGKPLFLLLSSIPKDDSLERRRRGREQGGCPDRRNVRFSIASKIIPFHYHSEMVLASIMVW